MTKAFIIDPIWDLPNENHRAMEWDAAGRGIFGWINPLTQDRKEYPHEFGPGAMWRAFWYPRNMNWDNETEPHVIVACPNNHAWDIDSRCSNCTMPEDRLHRCWVRTGTAPNLTVSKSGGLTCAAGGGSIMAGDYHGSLQNGMFT